MIDTMLMSIPTDTILTGLTTVGFAIVGIELLHRGIRLYMRCIHNF